MNKLHETVWQSTASWNRHNRGVDDHGYLEVAPAADIADYVQSVWFRRVSPVEAEQPARILPDGCMDLMRIDGRIMVAGPDITASVSPRDGEPFVGLRFHPGVLPRLLAVPASELRNQRVQLSELHSGLPRHGSLTELAAVLASEDPRPETAPWSLSLLGHVTSRLAAGSTVADVARDIGWSSRTLQRQCAAIYGYGPAMLRRILRFRRAVRMLDADVPVRARGFALSATASA